MKLKLVIDSDYIIKCTYDAYCIVKHFCFVIYIGWIPGQCTLIFHLNANEKLTKLAIFDIESVPEVFLKENLLFEQRNNLNLLRIICYRFFTAQYFMKIRNDPSGDIFLFHMKIFARFNGF